MNWGKSLSRVKRKPKIMDEKNFNGLNEGNHGILHKRLKIVIKIYGLRLKFNRLIVEK